MNEFFKIINMCVKLLLIVFHLDRHVSKIWFSWLNVMSFLKKSIFNEKEEEEEEEEEEAQELFWLNAISLDTPTVLCQDL